MTKQMKNQSKKGNWKVKALTTIVGASILAAGIDLLPKPDPRLHIGDPHVGFIEHPVFHKVKTEYESPSYIYKTFNVYNCIDGYLKDPDVKIKESRLIVFNDIKDNTAPYLLFKDDKEMPGGAIGELHLKQGDNMPEYESFGQAGAMVYLSIGKYPCKPFRR